MKLSYVIAKMTRLIQYYQFIETTSAVANVLSQENSETKMGLVKFIGQAGILVKFSD